jgi:hypothetical protein
MKRTAPAKSRAYLAYLSILTVMAVVGVHPGLAYATTVIHGIGDHALP